MKKLYSCFLCVSVSFCQKLPQKVVICGVCKNVASRLPYTINIMEKVGDLFSDYRVIVYENNSSDKTSQLLKEWSKKNSKVLVMSEYLTLEEYKKLFVNMDHAGKKGPSFFKPEPIARARNIVQNIAMSEEYAPFEFLIWIDMDFKQEPSYEGFIDTFTSNKQWDAVFAYGMHPGGRYYDWFALRDYQYPIGPELLGNEWWKLFRTFVVQRGKDWHPVYSAFGGCGIYRKSSVQGCQYSAWVTKDLESFYKKIFSEISEKNKFVQKYLEYVRTLKQKVSISCPAHYNLSEIKDPLVGIVIESISEDIIWRMNTFTYKYPVVCEHVTLHASMIAHGHDKLFINPNLVFYYAD